MRGIVVVAIGAALIWIGLSTDESGVDASEVAEVRADDPTASSSGAPEDAAVGTLFSDHSISVTIARKGAQRRKTNKV